MKANELRIGNYVEIAQYPNDREIIKLDSGNAIDQSIKLNAKPIPLTEEWLVKFGFEKLTDVKDGFKTTSYSHKKYSFIIYFDGERLSVNFWQGNEKKYIHQLQNLYFALTGEELKLKEDERETD